MGKIKVRTLGTDTEEQEKKNQKKKKEEKKLAKVQGSGGQRVPIVGPSEEELAKLEKETAEQPKEEKLSEAKSAPASPAGRSGAKKKAKFAKPERIKSKKYKELSGMVDKKQSFPIPQALELLEKLQRKTFDETVELHFNTKEAKISASTTLPHGTGKSLKVAIASDELIGEIEKGKVDFDILLANPSMMPKLAKVAKILGPKGLMPNPKNGTITNNPDEAAKKYEGGLTFIKSESKAPLIHIAVGKVSFGVEKLEENIDAVISAIKKENIEKAVLKSTMSPAIRLQI